MSRRRILVAAAAGLAVSTAALALLTHRLGADSLRGDEAIYARVVHETRAAGPWLPLRLYDAVYMNKPPLGFFAIRAAFAAAGESSRSARLPAALAGAATAGLLMAYGALRFGFAPGLFAAGFYVTAPIALGHHGLRGGTFDAATALLVLGALVAYCESSRPGRERLFRWTVALVAVATLFKTLTAAVLVAGSVLAVELLRRRQSGSSERGDGRRGRRRALARPALIFGTGVLVLLGWVVVLVAAGAEGAFERVVLWDLVERNVSGVHESHHGPWWFYFARLRLDASWCLLLLLPLAWALIARRPKSEPADHDLRLHWAAALLAIFLLLSLSASSTPWYGLQLLAPLALALAAGAGALLGWLPRPARVVAGLLLVATLVPRVDYARARTAAPALRVTLDRLHEALAAVPEARLTVRPGLDPLTAPPAPETYRWVEGAANSFYLASAPALAVGWPPSVDGGSCPVALVERGRLDGGETPAAPASGWQRYDLPPGEGPFALLDGCGGRVVATLAR